MVLASLLLVASLPVRGDGQHDVGQWLNRMATAIRSLNYDGTFVFLHDQQMETMRIIHGVHDGRERERLISLNGEPREVVRDEKSVSCTLPGEELVLVEKSRGSRMFPSAFPMRLDSLSRYYDFRVVGDDRVAGRASHVIAIRPKDGYRYGYRLWVDHDTGMLLRSDLLDENGTPVEQMMFTHIRLDQDIPLEDLQASMPPSHRVRMEERTQTGPEGEAGVRWRVAALPGGFENTRSGKVRLGPGEQPVDHMVFTDGLATVSVFVEPVSEDDSGLDGASRMGAVSAFGRVLGDYRVTVVGEVPPATVEQMALSAEPVAATGSE
jgi:sigma-E factor negative regulatory protein RseB